MKITWARKWQMTCKLCLSENLGGLFRDVARTNIIANTVVLVLCIMIMQCK